MHSLALSDPDNPDFDLNGDLEVTFAIGPPGSPSPSDSDVLIYNIMHTRYGDADLNRQVFPSDLITLATNYRQSGPFGWAQGNFNGNEVAGTSDDPRRFLSGPDCPCYELALWCQ